MNIHASLHRQLKLSCATLALAGGVLAGGVLAAPAAHAADEVSTVKEVIVTAQKRRENLQVVPLSVVALSGERLQTLFTSGDDVLALASRVPGLYAESSNGRAAPRFYIRGLGNTDFDLAASQPVSVIIDDVVMENVALKSSPIYDLDRVEVLRGPQGSLFGRNTTAGIVKFDTIKPSQAFSARAAASYGTFNTATFDGGVGGALGGESLSGRLSVLLQHRDDWVSNTFTGAHNSMGGFDERAARAQLLFTPSADTSVLWNLHTRALDGTSALFRANILTKGSNKLNSSFHVDKVAYDGGGGNNQAYDGWGSSLNLVHHFGDLTLTSITAYENAHGNSRGDIDGSAGPYTFNFGPGPNAPGDIRFPSDTQDSLKRLGQFTEEIRLAGGSPTGFNWQTGAFYFDTKYRIKTDPFFGPAPTVQQTNKSWAVFGQASWAVSEDLRVTGGARYTKDDKHLNVIQPLNFFPPVSASDGQVSWDLSAFYKVNPDVGLYARVARGFRGPSIQGRDISFFGPPSVANSETALSYEAGWKSELFDRHVRLNGAVFAYSIDHMQFSAIGGAGNTTMLINARRGDAYGLELDGEWVVNENLVLTAGYSYNHTRIADPNLKVAACPIGLCTVTNPVDANNNASVNGNPFPQAPLYIFDFTARWSMPVGNNGEIFAFTDWNVQGRTNFFLYQSKEFYSTGNYEGGLKVGYAHDHGRWEAALFARNITDQHNLKGGIDFNNLTGFVNDPRVIGISLSIKR